MPKLKDGRFRKTRDGLWQVRYRRDGYEKQFTSKNLNTVKDAFREWVRSVKDEKKDALPKKTQNFFDFSERYFLQVKRANVEKQTYETQHRCAELHIYPTFGALPIRQISPMKCQELLNGILAEGKGRTAETVKFILGEVFRAAVGERIITSSPMQYVKIPRHIRENGKALSLDTVRAFVAAIEKSPYRKQFFVYLYTGIRRGELHSLQIEGDFISVICGKCRKGQKKRRRKIPIAPELRAVLPLSEEDLAVENDVLTGNFKKTMPRAPFERPAAYVYIALSGMRNCENACRRLDGSHRQERHDGRGIHALFARVSTAGNGKTEILMIYYPNYYPKNCKKRLFVGKDGEKTARKTPVFGENSSKTGVLVEAT